MKKNRLLFLTLAFMMVLQLSAQDQLYSSFLHEGKTWKLKQTTVNTTSEVNVTVEGDTIVDGKICKKLICNDEGKKSLFAVMEEEGEKVYGYDGDKFAPVFDFGLTVGDTLPNCIDTIVIAATDTVEYNGRIYRRQLLHKTNGYTSDSFASEFYEYWVEGIGSMYAPNQPYCFATPGNRYLLLSVDDYGETLIDSEGMEKLFPPVLTGIRPSECSNHRVGGETFDLSGRKIQLPQYNRPYIRGGKKYISK
jgi:hypothetical protein